MSSEFRLQRPHARPLGELLRHVNAFGEIAKVLERERFEPVAAFLSTIPKGKDGVYRSDCYVNGIYVVDVENVRRGRGPQIKQDFLVQWLDGRTPPIAYYSGIPRSKAHLAGAMWFTISDFCREFGVFGQYGCPDAVAHGFSGTDDPRLPQEREWREAFAAAMERVKGRRRDSSRREPLTRGG